MKKWQEERNYRRVRNEGGEVIANIITVDGMDVEVPEDVYLAYAQADRRERYIMEEQSSRKLLSLEQMEEDVLLPDYVGAETAPAPKRRHWSVRNFGIWQKRSRSFCWRCCH